MTKKIKGLTIKPPECPRETSSVNPAGSRNKKMIKLLAGVLWLAMILNPGPARLLAEKPEGASSASETDNNSRAFIEKREPDTAYFNAREVVTWHKDGMRLFVAEENVTLRYNEREVRASACVIWFDEIEAKEKPTVTLPVYFEGDVLVRQGRSEVKSDRAFFRLSNVSKIIIDDEDHRIARFRKPVPSDLLTRAKEAYKAGYVEPEEKVKPGKKEEKIAEEIEKQAPSPLEIKEKEVSKPKELPPVEKKAPSGEKFQLPPLRAVRPEEFKEMLVVSEKEAQIKLPVEPPLFIYGTNPEGFKTETWQQEGTRIVVLTGGVNVVTREYKIKPKYEHKVKDLERKDIAKLLSELPEDEVDVTDIEMVADNIVLFIRDMTEEEARLYERGKKGRKYIEAYAEGNVAIYEDGLVMKGPRIFYDKTAKKGIIIDGRLEAFSKARAIPMTYEARVIRRASKDVFIAKKARLSTCEFGKPHIWLAATTMTVAGEKDDRIATSYNNAVFVGGVPIFYWPVLKTRLQGEALPLRRIRFTNDSDFGNRVQTVWDLLGFGADSSRVRRLDKWSNLYLTLDFLEKRGLGVGLDFEYTWKDAYGFFTSYYINDRGEDFPGQVRQNDERGRFRWQHRSFLRHDLQLDFEFSYISDANFLNEYFERELKEEKVQESLIYFKYTPAEFAALTLLFRPRVNDFQTQTEYLPQGGLNIIGYPVKIPGGKLTFYSDSEVASVRRRFPDGSGISEPTVFRADSRNELYWPFSLGPVHINPFGGLHYSYFDDTAANGNADRFAWSYGLRASTQLHRIFNVESDLFNIHKIRHIIIPDVQYRRIFNIGLGPSEIIQNDVIDTLDNLDVFSIGIRQRWQTKRLAKSADPARAVEPSQEDLALFDVEMSVFPNEDRDNAGERLSNIEWRGFYNFSNRVSFLTDGELQPRSASWKVINAGFRVNHSPKLSFYAGNRYADDADSSVFVFRLDYKVNERWKVGYYEEIDYGLSNPIERKIILERRFHCWIGQFVFERDEGENAGAGATTVMVQFMPVGVPEFKMRF